MVPENVITHSHGWVGCYLADGVDPTAPLVALPPGAFAAAAAASNGAPAPGFGLLASGPQAAIPALVTYLTLACAYFALGVAVGALARRLGRVRTPVLAVLVVPGVLAGLGLLAWIVYSLA